jgi:hypothetical protein
MKLRTATLLLGILPALSHATELTGKWVSCSPKSPWAYVLLSVERQEQSHSWIAEWGANYAANGAVHQKNGELQLRGCSSYRGEISSGCDESSPPVFTHLKKQDFERIRSSFTSEDLGLNSWVRVPIGTSWETLAEECERLIEKMNAARKGASR